jgi:hypothetical protein
MNILNQAPCIRLDFNSFQSGIGGDDVISNADVAPPPRGQPVNWFGSKWGAESAGDFQ